MDTSSAKLTPEIAHKLQSQIIKRMGPIDIPAESVHPAYVPAGAREETMSFTIPADWSFADLEEYLNALQSLWTAVKDKEHWRIGYNPAFTAAVEKLRKLEQPDTEARNDSWRNQPDGAA
jgi:hypothetical protein